MDFLGGLLKLLGGIGVPAVKQQNQKTIIDYASPKIQQQLQQIQQLPSRQSIGQPMPYLNQQGQPYLNNQGQTMLLGQTSQGFQPYQAPNNWNPSRGGAPMVPPGRFDAPGPIPNGNYGYFSQNGDTIEGINQGLGSAGPNAYRYSNIVAAPRPFNPYQ